MNEEIFISQFEEVKIIFYLPIIIINMCGLRRIYPNYKHQIFLLTWIWNFVGRIVEGAKSPYWTNRLLERDLWL